MLFVPWFFGEKSYRYAKIITLAVLLYLLPLILFTNLHFIHEYYQIACTVYVIFAVSVLIGGWIKLFPKFFMLIPIATLLIMTLNLQLFSKSYGIVIARGLNQLDQRSVFPYKVGRYLRDVTPKNSVIIVAGQGYNAQIAYESQRKTITIPPWFKGYQSFWQAPEKYTGQLPISAFVICSVSDEFPSKKDLERHYNNANGWVSVSKFGCDFLFSKNLVFLQDK
jgi:hypothetical protein